MPRPLQIATASLLAAIVLLVPNYVRRARAQGAPEQLQIPTDPALNVKAPVIATIPLPAGFSSEGWAPIWFQGGEVAVIARRRTRVFLLGYGGAGFQEQKVLAPAEGPDNRTTFVFDLAENRKQTMLALALGHLDDNHLDITIRNVSDNQPPHRLAHIEGSFAAVGLSWIDFATLALGVIPQPPVPTPTATPDLDDDSPTPSPTASPTPAQTHLDAGLYAVSLHRDTPIRKIKLNCPRQMDFTHTVWSPDGRRAVVDSGGPPPMLIDRISAECTPINIAAGQRFRFIGWSQDSARFLYAIASANGYLKGLVGFFEFDPESGQSQSVAAPAAAAIYLQGGVIAALGSRKLNPRLLASTPDLMLSAELAMIDTRMSQITIAPLGFETPAASLLGGALAYSELSEELAVQLFFPDPAGSVPLIVSFFPQTRKVKPIVAGKPGSVLRMAWSPIGDLLAVLNVSASPPVLTILSPPLYNSQPAAGGAPAR
jgi:hypothetical protein